MICRQCRGIEKFFDEGEAKKDFRKYRKSGPSRTTQALVEAIKAQGIEGKSLLDIGGGVGVIQHELLRIGVSSSVGVDASTAYIAAAKDEARRQGHADRIGAHHGDFVDLADDIQTADIVTMDRVICCYHDMEQLVGLSCQRSASLYGLVYPRETWVARLEFGLFNLYMWLRRNPFRVFVHPTAAVDSLIRRNGFEQRFSLKTMVWQVVLYGR